MAKELFIYLPSVLLSYALAFFVVVSCMFPLSISLHIGKEITPALFSWHFGVFSLVSIDWSVFKDLCMYQFNVEG